MNKIQIEMLKNVQHIANNNRNFSLIIINLYLMDIALLLVANCKSDIIINRT